jgi:hypothetical protein
LGVSGRQQAAKPPLHLPVCLEDLVGEGELGLRELPADDAGVAVLLERREADRAEELLGRAEPREEPLEVAAAEGLAMARTRALLAVPGGPRRRTCSPASPAQSAPSMTSRRSGNRAARSSRSWRMKGRGAAVVVIVRVLSSRRRR